MEAMMVLGSVLLVFLPLLLGVTKVRSQDTASAACTDAEYQCILDGWCIPKNWQCDYYQDCMDNTDEESCGLPPADMNISIIYSTTNAQNHSMLWKQFGNPDDYATKLGNTTANNRSIPIRFMYFDFGQPAGLYDAIAVDYANALMYIVDNANHGIHSGPFVYSANFTAADRFHEKINMHKMTGAALDWVAQNLYFTDGVSIQIVHPLTSDPSVFNPGLLSNTSLYSVIAIDVDPINRYLFWADAAVPNTIVRADLLASNRVNIAVGCSPTKLQVNVTEQKIYFLDPVSGKFGHVAYDGSDEQTLIPGFDGFSTFAVYENYLFLGETNSLTIQINNKETLEMISSYTNPESGTGGYSVNNMVVFSARNQPPGNSPCATSNGGCSHICIATSATTKVCQCQDGYTLQPDAVTCSKSCTDSEYKCVLDGWCIPKNGQCDYYQDCMDNTDEASCGLPPADMNISIIYSTTNAQNHSMLWKQFGNPDDYATKLGNTTANNRSIPIRFMYFDFGQPAGLYDAIAVDYANALMYIVDNANHGIHSGPFVYSANFTAADRFHEQMNMQTMTGAALDWVAQNLYFTDGVSIQIVHPLTSDPSVFNPGLLSNTSLYSVIAIDVDPINRYLFWVDAAVPNTIVRADLLANNRINITVGCSPTKLQVNVTEQKIYFLDPISGKFGYVAYDGSNVQTLIPGFDGFSTFAVYENYLFLGETNSLSIQINNKETLEMISSYTNPESGTGGYSVNNMIVFSARSQPPGNNKCTVNNGGCDQICIATSDSLATCMCGNGFTPAGDMRCTAISSGQQHVSNLSMLIWTVMSSLMYIIAIYSGIISALS